jgi:putative tricarboxylic transport membrane protein
MHRTTLIEGILFIAFGAVGISEAYHLYISKNPQLLYAMVQPGFYIFGLSLALVILGASHLFVNYRKPDGRQEEPVSGALRMRMVGIIVALLAYGLLINIAGYLIASVIFFLIAFRILDIKSWRTNAILSLSFAAVNYLIFVQLCDVIFPQGLLFSYF